jgi:alpha-galactosidase
MHTSPNSVVTIVAVSIAGIGALMAAAAPPEVAKEVTTVPRGHMAPTARAPREAAVILTPKPSAKPRINGPKIFGVRPGRPFLFTIPATGRRPMEFAVDHLPEGLKVNSQTGRITGSLANRGDYVVTFRARNASGQAERKFKIVCGDALALTPSMGWNSYYIWQDRVSDNNIRDAADAMVSTGMIDHGYTYVSIDGFWQVKPGAKDPLINGPGRDAQGNVIPNKRFPDMKALTDYIHSKGLKAGFYSTPDVIDWGGLAGSGGHEEQDARQFAAWGFDLLKYDYSDGGPLSDKVKNTFRKMGDLLQGLDRDVVYNICIGYAGPWAREAGGHSWRTGWDLCGTPDGVAGMPTAIFGHVFSMYGGNEIQKWCGPGGWNDPDYLMLGHLGDWKGGSAPTPLTPNEQYAHMSLWCLLAAPLFLGGDITRLDEFTLGLLCNDEVLDVDQDALGDSAICVARVGGKNIPVNKLEDAVPAANARGLEVWAKKMEDGNKAVGLFNCGTSESVVTAKWSDLGLAGKQTVRDLWRQKDLGTFDGQFSAPVGRHGVVLVRIAPVAVQ